MSKKTLGLWDYLKAAFTARLPVKGLGGLPLNYLALGSFGLLGLINPGFWLVGAGLELAYLFSVTHNQRFRNLVDNDLLEEDQASFFGRQEQLQELLPSEARERLTHLQQRCDRVRDLSRKLGLDEGSFDAWSLASMQVIYQKLLLSHSVLQGQLAEISSERLARELDEAETQLLQASDDDFRLQQTLTSTVDILKKRIANVTEAQGKLRYITAELSRIEQQVELIVEEAALAKEANHLSSYIDSVVQTFGATETWLSANLDLSDQEIEREARHVAASMQRQTGA